jgi:hypothetical protein
MTCATLVVVWLSIGAAALDPQKPATNLQPFKLDNPQIIAWLECTECPAGTFDAVIKAGAAAISELSRVLLQGPPPDKRQAHESYLRQTYAELQAYQRTHRGRALPYNEDQFVTRDMTKYDATYRVRAARALGEIGGAEAIRALDQALKLRLDPYALRKITEAQARATRPKPQGP